MTAPSPPARDSSVDALPEALRAAIAAHWTRRVVSELQVARSFEALAPRLRAIGADATVVRMIARAAEEEVRHAEICRRLASAYSGAEVETPAVPFEMPTFGFSDERLEVALHVTGLCCINETLATAYLEHCLSIATAPIAVAANRAHLREEIDHARVGWAHLASSAVGPGLRAEVGACVPRLLAANVPHWERADPSLPAEGVPAHGLPSHAESRRVAREATRDLVLPGFRHVGIDAGTHVHVADP